MAHKSQGVCPMTAAMLIRSDAKRRGLSVNEAIIHQAKELDVPVETLRKWVWPAKKVERAERPFWQKLVLQLDRLQKALALHSREIAIKDDERIELLKILKTIERLVQEAEVSP
jgi:hypothetical protein